MKSPQKNISGSVQKKNGKWYLVLNLYTENGTRKQKWINTGLEIRGNKKNAEKLLEKQIQEYNNCKITTSNFIEKKESVLFCDFAKEWLNVQKNKVDDVSFASDELTIRVHLYPYFKEKQYLLKDINSDIINQYFRDKQNGYGDRKRLSGTSLQRHHATISSILKKAIKDGYIEQKDIDEITKPKNDTKQTSWYTPEQINELIRLIKNKNIKLLLPVLLASYYGLRREEIVGIKESDIDFNNHVIYIQNSIVTAFTSVETKDGIVNKTVQYKKDFLKNDSSKRCLPLTPELEICLKNTISNKRKYMELLGNTYNHENDEYILLHENGNLITPTYLTHTFSKFIKKNCLPKITLHGLRHSCASLLLDAKFSMKEIQEWLGHSSYETTARIYAHVYKNSKTNMINEVSEKLCF